MRATRQQQSTKYSAACSPNTRSYQYIMQACTALALKRRASAGHHVVGHHDFCLDSGAATQCKL